MVANQQPDVTVLVPALNEQDTISEVVDRLLALPLAVQVIVINDGSTDGTAAALAAFGDRIQVLTNPGKTGKGSAIRQALPFAKGKATIIQDADLEYFPEEIPTLVAPILEGKAAVAALTDALKDEDEGVRTSAAQWLKKIDPEAAKKAGVK